MAPGAIGFAGCHHRSRSIPAQAADSDVIPGYRVAVFDEGLHAAAGHQPAASPVGFAIGQVRRGCTTFTFPDALDAPFVLQFALRQCPSADDRSGRLRSKPALAPAAHRWRSSSIPCRRTFPSACPQFVGDGLHPDSDSGVAGPNNQATLSDRVTNDTTPTFWGRAEANAIVRAYLDVNEDGLVDDGDVFIGMTVAVPLDGSNQFPGGYWQLTSVVDMNDPAASNLVGGLVSLPLDGLRRILVTAEDVAGNVSAPQSLDIFIDTQGPQITAVRVPMVIRRKTLATITWSATITGIGSRTRIGTRRMEPNGSPPVAATGFPRVDGGQPNRRWSPTVRRSSPAATARRAVRGSLYGRFPGRDRCLGCGQRVRRYQRQLHPRSHRQGRRFHQPGHHLHVRSGQRQHLRGQFFADPGDPANQADGFHKLAAYGRYGGTNRWLIDTDNNGVPNLNLPDGLSIDGLPLAGRFWDGVVRNGIDIDPNSDQVGVKKGTTWYLDTNANLIIDAGDVVLAGNMPGMPIVGDFDGDGIDDLGSWVDDVFYIDLSSCCTGVPESEFVPSEHQRFWDVKFDFGFTGSASAICRGL
jgi:hypothetical protein